MGQNAKTQATMMRRQVVVLLAATALLGVALLAAVARSPVDGTAPTRWGRPEPNPRVLHSVVTGTSTRERPEPSAVEPLELPDGLATGIVAGVIVAVTALLALVAIRVLRRHRRRPADEELSDDAEPDHSTDVAQLQEAVRRAHTDLERLRREGRPGDAVIAAWTRLEALAADSGAGRLDHQTPTEFTDALVACGLPETALAELRRRYHRARFSWRPVDDADAAAADAAMQQITAAVSTLEPSP